MNLDTFANESLAQVSVSKYTTSGNSWKDGGYLGQCVSEVNQFCYRVLDVPAGSWGNAVDWASPSNPNRAYFDEVSSIQEGDIIVYGSNFGGGYGHIGISYQGKLLDQNGDGQGRVAVRSVFVGYIAILRKKGGDMVPASEVTHRDEIIANQEAQLAQQQAKINELISTLNIQTQQIVSYEATMTDLRKQIADGNGTVLTSGTYIVS